MEDQMPDIVLEISDDSNKALESTNVTPSLQSGVEGSIEATDASQYSNDSQATSVDEEPKLPILKKIDDLIDKFQTLKKDHTILSNEVKDVTSQFFGSEILSTLQHLSKEHELLKKKFMEESELLKKKCSEEYAERKRLYNEVIELKGNIRVFCRCRPLNQEEIANGSSSVIEILPSQDQELSIICADSSKKQFKFDHVFGPHVEQEEVFAQTAPIVTSVLDGYNVCIFAYGQTGTGKTFTMEGTPENRGVNYRTLEELFKIANHRNGTMRYELFVSMVEVYNEKIRDLLVENNNEPPKKLEVKQAPEGTLEIPGLVEAPVYRTEEVWELLKTGSRVRSVGSTNANEFSSRSHCLLRVTVKGENLLNGHRTKSNLWLVDLAGSERVGRIDVEGERLKESQFINKSLSALGDVISALATKTAHVPYRNSKLTHMLQSSLGGDCKTLMFVQISPSSADLGETLCSLNFASRVKGIEYGPARKQADFSELLKYKHMVEKLKHDEKETKKLQETVQSLQLRLSAREFNCRTLQEKVKDLENQLAEERKNRNKQDSRAVAATSSRQPIQEQKKLTEKRPPLGPSNTRIPLRVSNLAQPTSIQAKKIPNMSSRLTSYEGKENNQNEQYRRGSIRGPRRVSIAVRPSSEKAAPQLQPKRRISIATWRPESSLQSTPMSKQTKRESAMPRPSLLRAAWRPEPSLQGTPMSVQPKRESAMPRPSLLRDYSKVRRFSKQFSPMPETPKSSRRFMGSPPTEQVGSWKPKHPTVVALQKKPVVWSPLKLRGLKNFRRSIV